MKNLQKQLVYNAYGMKCKDKRNVKVRRLINMLIIILITSIGFNLYYSYRYIETKAAEKAIVERYNLKDK